MSFCLTKQQKCEIICKHKGDDRMKKLDQKTENKLKEMYHQIEEDFKSFPYIVTTEDFFRWREAVKEANGDDGELRNEEVERIIRGNHSLELLYDWSKFYRMIDRTKAKVYTTKEEYGIEDPSLYHIKATKVLHEYLVENHKGNTEQLFGIFQIPELNLGTVYSLKRTINTPYEFERIVVKEEYYEPWQAKLFVTLLRAYEIEGKDLLAVGREVEAIGNNCIQEIEENYANGDSSFNFPKTYQLGKK